MASPFGRRAAAAGLLLLAWGCGPFAPVAPPAARQAPDLRLPDLAGRSTALSDFKGKVVLLDFWSTTCEACLPSVIGQPEELC